jgi:hypothetical protein
MSVGFREQVELVRQQVGALATNPVVQHSAGSGYLEAANPAVSFVREAPHQSLVLELGDHP